MWAEYSPYQVAGINLSNDSDHDPLGNGSALGASASQVGDRQYDVVMTDGISGSTVDPIVQELGMLFAARALMAAGSPALISKENIREHASVAQHSLKTRIVMSPASKTSLLASMLAPGLAKKETINEIMEHAQHQAAEYGFSLLSSEKGREAIQASSSWGTLNAPIDSIGAKCKDWRDESTGGAVKMLSCKIQDRYTSGMPIGVALAGALPSPNHPGPKEPAIHFAILRKGDA
eukprot:3781294-Amphidinium_carterae.1